MAIRYSPEVHEFIAANVQGRTCEELTDLTNTRMGTHFTTSSMKSYKKNHHLKSGTKGGHPKGWSPVYPAGMEEYIRGIASGRTTAEIAALVNDRFKAGTISATKVRAYNKNHGITSGVNTRFEPGHVPASKGKRQSEFMSKEGLAKCQATQFKPGNIPENQMDVGMISKNTDGYLLRKKQMEGTQWERWEFLHRAVWEEHNDPIPDGMVVSFKNGNREDVSIENLMLISNTENLELTRSGLRFDERDLTSTGLNIVKLKLKIRDRRSH